jgi:hypothetical protein
MSDLLLLVASPGDRRADPAASANDAVAWPWTSSGATAWAARLHDELDAVPTAPSEDDIARIASWLRTQAIGRDAVVVAEPRLTRYAAVWAGGAKQAGVRETRLADSADGTGEPVVVDAGAHPPAAEAPTAAGQPTALPRHIRVEQARLWVLDRAEETARVAVRALQR